MKNIYKQMMNVLKGLLIVGVVLGLLYITVIAGMNGYLNHPCLNQEVDIQLCMTFLLDLGCKKQKLRAHSDFYPNEKVNEWALSFLDNFDIQCEAKAKNLLVNNYMQYINT